MHYLGIDWATEKHDLCLQAEDGRILSEFTISHDAGGFEQLREILQEVPDVKINIERSDGLLVDVRLSDVAPLGETHAEAEWKVITHIARIRRPTRNAARSRISPAALLVKVIARISFGFTPQALIRCATR